MQKSSPATPVLLRLLPIILLASLILLFFNKLAFSNLILARGDTFLYFYPYWSAAAEALGNGRIPLWNPQLFMGAPLLANSQVGFFYPLNWPVWLLLPTPYAVSASIIIHLFIAAIGAYWAAKRVLAVEWGAALVTAVAFGLGGYLSAQVEHINQLQGLAWLPWFLVIIGPWQLPTKHSLLKKTLGIAILFALQLSAGHTQTAFISGIGLGLWLLTETLDTPQTPTDHNRLTRIWRFAPLLLGSLFALALLAVQLLPTLELTQLSSRQSGLTVNEVLSFSLNPLLFTRAFLPAFGQSLFSEYVTVLPLTVLALAFIGGWQWRQRGVLPAIVWVLVGILLALGVFNPANWLLARLPGFNLFRVPARWLILYALGIALLAGVGWQTLIDTVHNKRLSSASAWRRVSRPLHLFLIVTFLLMAWGFAASLLVARIPIGAEAPFETPSQLTIVGWVGELLLLGILAWWVRKMGVRHSLESSPSGLRCGPEQEMEFKVEHKWIRPLPFLLGLLIVTVLFLSTRTHPYNNPTTPEAYFDLRPPITRLQTDTATPPGRFLSLSDIFFDPGDHAEIDTIYADQLSTSALYDYTIAIKQKEIIAPNLPLSYGLSAVDGFDGGILPLRDYSQLVTLLLPPGLETSDGRLRELLTAVPDPQWLDLFNARYLITDKVGDQWRDGLFFDQQHPTQLTPGAETSVGYIPPYEATELLIIASALPDAVQINTATGHSWRLTPEQVDDDLYRVAFPETAVLQTITLTACAVGPCQLTALTLADSRDGTFQPLVPGAYRLIHSGDVKIYENLDVMPRAFMVGDWQWVADGATAVAAMNDPNFDSRTTAVLIPPTSDSPQPQPTTPSNATFNPVEIISYEPEQIVLHTNNETAGLLLLSDAYYPGWATAVDSQTAKLYQANTLFRGVFVPAGKHEITFTYKSDTFTTGLTISTIAFLLAITLVFGSLILHRPQNDP